MTPSELELAARRRFNAVNDPNWTQAEMFELIYQAQMELANETLCIQNKYTTPTVASQQAYAWPTRAISIKRVTYDGSKLDPIDMREDDAISLSNTTTTVTGTPQWYFSWERAIYLRHIPSAVADLDIWTYDIPDTVVATSALDVPASYHPSLIYYILAEMAMKDGDFALSDRYRGLWDTAKIRIKRLEAIKKRGDGPARIKDIDMLAQSSVGTV